MNGPARRIPGLPGPAQHEQRAMMLAKVEALIVVLELARGKVLTGLAARGADAERLFHVRRQVEATLQVCRKARAALRGDGTPITQTQIRETDLDALCARLAHPDPV